MICVLDVTAGPARGKRFWIRSDQRVEIGRLSSADFAIPADAHMSRRHLILEGTHSIFRVRDVGSVNGTFVNNAKINAVELCAGDQIRAGETTFEVSMLSDQENPHAKDGMSFQSSVAQVANQAVATSVGNSAVSEGRIAESSLANSAAGNPAVNPNVSRDVPLRVLNRSEPDPCDANASDAELTQRCRLEMESRTAPSSPRTAQNGTILSNNSWWSDYDFRVSDVPCLLDEASTTGTGNSLLPEILSRLEPESALTAIVDVERLGRYGRQQLSVLVEHGLVEWHGPSVCSVQDDRSHDFVRLIESSLCQDAIILIGAQTQLDSTWLRELVRQASRPSILSARLRDPHSTLIEPLLSKVEFVIFERDRSGRLSLLLRDLIELSD